MQKGNLLLGFSIVEGYWSRRHIHAVCFSGFAAMSNLSMGGCQAASCDFFHIFFFTFFTFLLLFDHVCIQEDVRVGEHERADQRHPPPPHRRRNQKPGPEVAPPPSEHKSKKFALPPAKKIQIHKYVHR